MRLSVIMPVFNEEKFIEKSLTALMQQTLRPTQIILVDDGSTDRTAELAAKFPVQLISLPKEKKAMMERVPSVIRAGTKHTAEFDYLAILDADTILEPAYFEKLTQDMAAQPKIGIAGGKLIGPGISTGLMLGLIPYVYGCNRLYTRKCWQALNGGNAMRLVPVWDFYHNVYAEMLGYTTKRYDTAQSWALRPPGYKKAFFNGYVSYQVGYYTWFLLFRAARSRKLGLIAGYLKAQVSSAKQYPIKPYVRALQVQRLKRLLRKLV
jgi:glycosyltransferase involved in cell wall biosynthesis